MKTKNNLVIIALFFVAFVSFSQPVLDSSQIKKRVTTVAISSTLVYSASLIGMNELWYKNSPRSKFHFFNDNPEWLQMDKCGHFFGAYHISSVGAEMYLWTGTSDRKARIYGALTGLLFQTPIEFLDAYSPDFGASWGDALANLSGSAFYLGQHAVWNEIRIQPKFSFHRTPYASIKPKLLGEGFAQEFLKDYNGQTYWLSGNVSSLLSKSTHVPKWFNVAIGYSGEEMLRGRRHQNENEGYDMYRQWYLSLDVDFSRIETNKRWLKIAFFVLNSIKVPFPALQLDRRNGLTANWIYF